MSDLETQSSDQGTPLEPGADDGLFQTSSEGTSGTIQSGAKPEELPEEFKPYSQFPWRDLPDETREEFLQHLKKFHGDMSRGAREAAELRRDLPELRQKADALDRLTSDGKFWEWYNAYTHGNLPASNQPAANEPALTEYLDQNAVTGIQKLIQDEVRRAINPLAQEVQATRQLSLTEMGQRQLNQLRQKVESNGWPSLDEKIPEMRRLVQGGRASDLEDAYFLVCRDEITRHEVPFGIQSYELQQAIGLIRDLGRVLGEHGPDAFACVGHADLHVLDTGHLSVNACLLEGP